MKIAVDAVVFGYSKEEGINLLLVKRLYNPFKGRWVLPGGFIMEDESLEKAVERELQEETGIKINYLEQLYTFGKVNRDPRKRIISVTYFGLVNKNRFLKLKASTDAEEANWFSISELPDLAFDHNEIVETAIKRLRAKLEYEPIGFELLEKKFPFSDLEQLYTMLLDREIDRRNFKKKIMKLGIVEELDEKEERSGSGRPGKLYRFKKNEYEKLKKEGMHFEI
ncbi:MAG: NUDIX domain-containing protein [Vicingaceae bacterium]|jgi:8-oxo-dGTP diphosphatase